MDIFLLLYIIFAFRTLSLYEMCPNTVQKKLRIRHFSCSVSYIEDIFTKTINGFQRLKSSILDVWQDFVYVPGIFFWKFVNVCF